MQISLNSHFIVESWIYVACVKPLLSFQKKIWKEHYNQRQITDVKGVAGIYVLHLLMVFDYRSFGKVSIYLDYWVWKIFWNGCTDLAIAQLDRQGLNLRMFCEYSPKRYVVTSSDFHYMHLSSEWEV